ncbi:hypothetical protein DH2020_015997 [Rehmannia glutinosa]|uniref:DUF7054 domain-containing protein n=1 Tax=Rehmannia glutinosa TaxID=99300 RepID=A0ABR0WYC9_REHGL
MKKSLSENTFDENNYDHENKNSMGMRLRRSISDKTMSFKDNKKKKSNNRFLITINVVGSAGPIRFVVNGEDNAGLVTEAALKMYAREGRLPIIGSDINTFFLYPANAGFDVLVAALKPSEAIGSRGARNFVLCKKQSNPQMTETRSPVVDRKGSGFKAWLQKSLSLKIPTH